MKNDLLNSLQFLPLHRAKTKRGLSLNLDQYIEEYRQEHSLSANNLDLIMMSYRYYHLFSHQLNAFKKSKIKPSLLEDLLLVSFAALMGRRPEKESLIIFNAVEAAKKRFGEFPSKLCNAFLRKAQKNKALILSSITHSPQIVLGDYIFKRFSQKMPKQFLVEMAQALLTRPKPGIDAFDEKLNWKKWDSQEFLSSPTPLQAIKKSSWDYAHYLRKKIVQKFPDNKKELHYLDACAAPGGKLIAAQLLLKDYENLNFSATEAKFPRYKTLKENLTKWNLEQKTQSKLHTWGDSASDEKPNFDIILADLPCSGLGTLQNRPDLLLIEKNFSWSNLFKIQKSIIQSLQKRLSEQSLFFVSICSIDPIEIEQISQTLQHSPTYCTPLKINTYSEFLTTWEIG